MTIIGLIGGLSPESGGWIYSHTVRECSNTIGYIRGDYTFPHVILWTIPINPMVIEDIEQYKTNGIQEIFRLISEGIEILKVAGATIIGISCNIMYAIFSKYYPLQSSGIRILNTIEETLKIVKDMKISIVGILGTRFIIKSGLYTIPLTEAGINTVFLPNYRQDVISMMIIKVLSDGNPKEKMPILKELILSMNVSTVILGCTELSLMITQEDIPSVMLINTLEALGDTLVLEYVNEQKKAIKEKN